MGGLMALGLGKHALGRARYTCFDFREDTANLVAVLPSGTAVLASGRNCEPWDKWTSEKPLQQSSNNGTTTVALSRRGKSSSGN